MKNTRNKYVDILRAFSLAYIIIYHIYALTDMRFKYNIINSILSFGGEIGVSIFFVISGFSIYKLLQKNKDNFSYKNYITQRLERICPHYYISLIVMLLFTNCAIYIGQKYLINIISHIFFFHNLFYNYHGTINGVLWTMGVTFQFYLIAPLLKKEIDKHPLVTTILSILFTLAIKYVLFIYILPINNVNGMYYFIYGRQLFTTLDAFVLGMFVSKYSEKRINNKNWILVILSLIAIFFMILLGSCYLPVLNQATIYSPTMKGVFYFIVLDLIIALLIYSLSNCKYKESKFNNVLLFFAKHEYAIYIWHLLIIDSFVKYSTLYGDIINKSYLIIYLVIFIFAILGRAGGCRQNGDARE